MPALRARGAPRGVLVTAKTSTNGTLLDEPFVAFARRHGLFLSLSVDGGPEAQDLERPYRGGAPTSPSPPRMLCTCPSRMGRSMR